MFNWDIQQAQKYERKLSIDTNEKIVLSCFVQNIQQFISSH